MAERKGIGYREAMCRFYDSDLESINKSLVYSLHKNTRAGRISISPRIGYDRGNNGRYV